MNLKSAMRLLVLVQSIMLCVIVEILASYYYLPVFTPIGVETRSVVVLCYMLGAVIALSVGSVAWIIIPRVFNVSRE